MDLSAGWLERCPGLMLARGGTDLLEDLAELFVVVEAGEGELALKGRVHHHACTILVEHAKAPLDDSERLRQQVRKGAIGRLGLELELGERGAGGEERLEVRHRCASNGPPPLRMSSLVTRVARLAPPRLCCPSELSGCRAPKDTRSKTHTGTLIMWRRRFGR